MANNTATKVINSRSGPVVVRSRSGKFMKVDGISRQLHRRYVDGGEFVTSDGRTYVMVPVVKVLVNNAWTTKF